MTFPQIFSSVEKAISIITTLLSHRDFFHWKFGLLFMGKTSCDRVVLPNLQCILGVSVFP